VRKPSTVQSLWGLQFAALLVLSAWAAVDPLFLPMVDTAQGWLTSPDSGYHHWNRTLGNIRPIALLCVLSIAFASMICILGGMLLQSNVPKKSSTLRSVSAWLTLTATFALWCSLVVHVEAIAWQGKRFRIAAQVDSMERIAGQLREGFPTQDGELPHLGPFMAYPFGQPSTLILLQSPPVNNHSRRNQSLYISAVERTASGAILLQLSGTDGGDWAEWHPPASRPQSFIGGLGDRHNLDSCYSIGRGWYLVRYSNT